DQRHDQVADDRIDDLAERPPDDDADRQVDDIALHREFLEFRREPHVKLLCWLVTGRTLLMRPTPGPARSRYPEAEYCRPTTHVNPVQGRPGSVDLSAKMPDCPRPHVRCT